MLPPFQLRRPATVEEAVTLLDDSHLGYWGGTELLLALNMGLLAPEGLVDLKRVQELAEIRVEGSMLIAGAGASHDELATVPAVRSSAPLLANVASRVGNARVRSQGSIGGNLCFAEPRSDLATVLAALDGRVELHSAVGSRTVAISDFVLGPYSTAREAGELLVRVCVPLPAALGVYLKYQTTERPTVGVAAVRLPDRSCRVVVGAVADAPIVTDYDDWDAVDPEEIAAQVEPADDLAGTAEYKRDMTAVFVARAVVAARLVS